MVVSGWRLLPCLVSPILFACPQEIVVLHCDAGSQNPDGGETVLDATDPLRDAAPGDDAAIMDGGDAAAGDAGAMDIGPDDAGAQPCPITARYCISDLVPSTASARVRDLVTFTPVVTNPNQLPLSFRVEAAELVATRRASLPEVDLDDLDLSYAVNAATGELSFSVSEVPTHFTTTSFTVRLWARGPDTADVDVYREATVSILGNVLMAGSDAVFAVASDGRPARSVNFTQGRLLSGASYVASPKSMLLGRDGTLLVYDAGSTPERIRRYALTGENVALADFAHTDGASMPYLADGNVARGMTELPDGRIAVADFISGRTPASRILVWNGDGSFDRVLVSQDPAARWQALACNAAGELLVGVYASTGRIVRLDPSTGQELGDLATDIASIRALASADGFVYVGQEGSAMRVSPQGAKQQLNALPGGGSAYWLVAAPFGPGRVLLGRDSSADSGNIAVVEGVDFVADLRPASAGGAYVYPYGLLFLD